MPGGAGPRGDERSSRPSRSPSAPSNSTPPTPSSSAGDRRHPRVRRRPRAGRLGGPRETIAPIQPTYAEVDCPDEVTVVMVVVPRCGYLTAPESRDQLDGRTVRIFVIRIDPVEATPPADAMVVTGETLGGRIDYGGVVPLAIARAASSTSWIDAGPGTPNPSSPAPRSRRRHRRRSSIRRPTLPRASRSSRRSTHAASGSRAPASTSRRSTSMRARETSRTCEWPSAWSPGTSSASAAPPVSRSRLCGRRRRASGRS